MAAAILKAMSKIAAIVPSFALQNTPTLQVTIGDKIVEIMAQSRRTKQSVPLPLPPPILSIHSWGLSCFQQVAWIAAQRCMEGVGEGKIYSLPFKLARRQRRPLGQSVSTNFVADCREIARERKRKTYITPSSLFFRVSSSTALDQSACEKSLCYCKTWIW